jgi:hypothetical protein
MVWVAISCPVSCAFCTHSQLLDGPLLQQLMNLQRRIASRARSCTELQGHARCATHPAATKTTASHKPCKRQGKPVACAYQVMGGRQPEGFLAPDATRMLVYALPYVSS